MSQFGGSFEGHVILRADDNFTYTEQENLELHFVVDGTASTWPMSEFEDSTNGQMIGQETDFDWSSATTVTARPAPGHRRAGVQLVGDVQRGGEPDRGGHGGGDGLRCGRRHHGLRDHRRRGPSVLLHRGDLRGADLRRGAELRGRPGPGHGQRLRGGGYGDQRHGDTGEDGDADHHGDGEQHRGAGPAGQADGDGGPGRGGAECDLARAGPERRPGDHRLQGGVPQGAARRVDPLLIPRYRRQHNHHRADGAHGIPGASAGDQRRGHRRLVGPLRRGPHRGAQLHAGPGRPGATSGAGSSRSGTRRLVMDTRFPSPTRTNRTNRRPK